MSVKLTGYVDSLSVAPGERLRFMISSEAPSYSATLVRLFHGDRNEAGPGFKQEQVESALDGTYEGREQRIHTGSFGSVDGLPSTPRFALTLWAFPTSPVWNAPQCLVSRRGGPSADGFALSLVGGRLALTVQRQGVETTLMAARPLAERRWHFICAGFDDGGELTLEYVTHAFPAASERVSETLPRGPGLELPETMLIAAAGFDETAGVRHPYNGKIASPRIYRRPLAAGEVRAIEAGAAPDEVAREALVGAWNLGSAPATTGFADESGRGHEGVFFNRPMTAVTDHRWDGSEFDWTRCPGQYEAAHFHSDDLADARWEPDFEWKVPDDLPSGVYAAWLRAGDREDHVPFVVRPPRDRADAEIALLMPTFTYLAYGNERLLETAEPLRESPVFEGAVFDPLKSDPRDEEWRQHPEFGLSLYDTHADGSGCCYATALRPILNMRPDYKLWATGAPRFLGGDLYMTDWLREKGFGADVITDHDLHFDGEALLRRYRVVITGGHPEYWSGQMLDAMQAYLDGGGRVMYLGGNGFYWVASLDPGSPEIIEVRRGNAATRVWESAPGEGYHSTTGELGGIWRHRGKLPNELTGIGYASLGYSFPSPGYARNRKATGPIVEMVFAGVDEDPFGEYGLVLGGAAGDEIDRVDPRRGSPERTILLASSTGYDDAYQLTHEEVMITTPGLGGSDNPDVRSDVAFMETANGGAVFSAGAISWRGSLSHNGYDNGVSRITENVLRAFLTTEEWSEPGSPEGRP